MSGSLPGYLCNIQLVSYPGYLCKVPINSEALSFPGYFCYITVPFVGAPGQPVIEGITETTVDLSWSRPSDDGGALDGYVIEAKLEDGEWLEMATTVSM